MPVAKPANPQLERWRTAWRGMFTDVRSDITSRRITSEALEVVNRDLRPILRDLRSDPKVAGPEDRIVFLEVCREHLAALPKELPAPNTSEKAGALQQQKQLERAFRFHVSILGKVIETLER